MRDIKIGDRVRVLGGSFSFSARMAGKIATVVEVYEDAIAPFGIRFDEPEYPDEGRPRRAPWAHEARDLELVEDTTLPTDLPKGTKLRVKTRGGRWGHCFEPGDVVEVRKPYRNGERLGYDVDGPSRNGISVSQVVPLDELELVPTHAVDFDTGAIVEVSSPNDVIPIQRPQAPARVRAQHAAERLVADLFDCTRTEARSDRLLRHAYQAAYRAFRQCQKEGAP